MRAQARGEAEEAEAAAAGVDDEIAHVRIEVLNRIAAVLASTTGLRRAVLPCRDGRGDATEDSGVGVGPGSTGEWELDDEAGELLAWTEALDFEVWRSASRAEGTPAC